MAKGTGEKREVVKVYNACPCRWKEGYAIVKYEDLWNGEYTSAPIKVHQRKNGSKYVIFEGRRVNISGSRRNFTKILRGVERGLYSRGKDRLEMCNIMYRC